VNKRRSKESRRRHRIGLWNSLPWWVKCLAHLATIGIVYKLAGLVVSTQMINRIDPVDIFIEMDFSPPEIGQPAAMRDVKITSAHPDGPYLIDGARAELDEVADWLSDCGNCTVNVLCDTSSTHGDLIQLMNEFTRLGLRNINVLSTR